jgi:hypothetical protein
MYMYRHREQQGSMALGWGQVSSSQVSEGCVGVLKAGRMRSWCCVLSCSLLVAVLASCQA